MKVNALIQDRTFRRVAIATVGVMLIAIYLFLFDPTSDFMVLSEILSALGVTGVAYILIGAIRDDRRNANPV